MGAIASARPHAQPAQGGGGTQGIEHLLLRAVRAIAEIDPPLAFAEVKVMVTDSFTCGGKPREFQEAVAEPRLPAIDHRRAQPLDNHRIALEQQTERLAKVPSVRVKVIFGRKLDHVPCRPGRDMRRNPSHKDEATIIVAVRRGKAPCAASALDRQWQKYFVLVDNSVEQRIDQRDLLAIHLRWDASQTHLSSSKAGHDLSAEAEISTAKYSRRIFAVRLTQTTMPGHDV